MFDFFAKKFRHGGQTCISHLQMILPRKKNNSLEKHIIFHTVLRIWASKLRSLVWKFHARLSKLHSTCTGEKFEKKVVMGKNVHCFYHFRNLIRICSEFLRKSTARWSKLHSTSTDDPSEKEEQISWITHNFFLRIWASNLRSLVWKIHARLSKLHSTCTKEQFEKNLMLGKKLLFYHLWILIKICSVFLRKSRARWSKLHSTSTDDPAEKEEQISWITHKFLQFFENSNVKFTEIGWNFMHGCKNCILHVRRNNSREIWCWGKKVTVFITFVF